MSVEKPLWKTCATASLADAVEAVGLEGMERLFAGLDAVIIRTEDAMTAHIPEPVGYAMVRFREDVADEMVRVAIQLGFALARTVTLADQETWLQDALRVAGLTDFTPDARLADAG